MISKMMSTITSVHTEGSQNSVALAVGEHFHSHFDELGVQDVFNTVAEVSALLSVVGKLVQVFKIDPLHKVASFSVKGK